MLGVGPNQSSEVGPVWSSVSRRRLRLPQVGQLIGLIAGVGLLLGASTVPAVDNLSNFPSVNSSSALAPNYTHANARICSGDASVNQLRVVRTVLFPVNHLSFTFPAVENIHSVSQVQQLLAIACHLPSIPVGVLNCPADFGIVYALTFSEASIPKLQIKADATGCELTTGIPTVTRVATPLFWTALAADLGLSKPVEYCNPFRGDYPGQLKPPCNPETPA